MHPPMLHLLALFLLVQTRWESSNPTILLWTQLERLEVFQQTPNIKKWNYCCCTAVSVSVFKYFWTSGWSREPFAITHLRCSIEVVNPPTCSHTWDVAQVMMLRYWRRASLASCPQASGDSWRAFAACHAWLYTLDSTRTHTHIRTRTCMHPHTHGCCLLGDII